MSSHIGQFMSGGVKSIRHLELVPAWIGTMTDWTTSDEETMDLNPPVDPLRSLVIGDCLVGGGAELLEHHPLKISDDGTKVQVFSRLGVACSVRTCTVIEYY